MRLKSLDVVGFKSFFEPTTIGFSPGVTAVVGPNGCGKSNVVDAIRWVLGEQAATRLRGKSIEDLLYAGNDSNQPAGMAEVSLLLEAEESNPLPDPYSALSELAVTRRAYRSGDSEYLINKIPCRLKDITEFFMAAQIHSRGYAIIEQGRVDEIIQAKPAELRAMVEEAAGLALFKGRRDISERKLERVRENLARVDDVLSEIERQLAFARRQAKKAEAYKLIRAELLELERLSAARRMLEQHSELSVWTSREVEVREKITGAREAAMALRGRTEEANAALISARDELAAAGRELHNLRTAFEERARTRGFLERRLGAIAELEPGLQTRMAELDVKATATRATRAHAGARLARESRESGGITEEGLKLMREEHRGAEKTQREAERHAEELKDSLAELMREAAVLRGRLGDLAGERAELEDRIRSFTDSSPEQITSLERYRHDAANAEAMLAAERNEVERCERAQHQSTEDELRLRTMLANHDARRAALREALKTARARSQPIMPNGAGEKLRRVMESLNGDRPPNQPAMLLDVIKAPPALEPALRAVLGDQLDAVVTDSSNFALRAVEILKETQSGRLSFIQGSIAPVSRHDAIEAPGLAGRLLDMVEVEQPFAPMAEALMGHVIVADDLNAAYAASNLNGYGTVFVTRDGDLLWPDRMISGGSGHHVESGEEIDFRKQKLAVEVAERALAEADAEREELSRLQDWAILAYRDDTESLAESRKRVTRAERTVSETRAAMAKAEQRMALAEANRSAAERRAAEISSAATASNARLEELARLEQDSRARLNEHAEALAAQRAVTRRLGEQMLEAAAKLETRKSLLNTLEQELRHQRQLADELDAQIAQCRIELDRARTERAEFEREVATLLAQDEAAGQRRAEVEASVKELEALCRRRNEEVEVARAELTNAEQAAEALESEAVQCELKRERARTLIEELERSFVEKFETPFEQVSSDLESVLMGRDSEKDETRLTELKARAEKIGEVNLAAESEVKELEERAAALQTERSDLNAAVNDLTHTIQKLNREARKRLAETFEGAAKNFSELFPKLMRGGKAHLELIGGDDVLEAGINVLVQPPGKRVKEIGLLSGGEKALSAMALIFSLFLLNPSPFCVMDEVDAPLDEFSLAAFTGLVRELKERSQFIIITHNQRTMQAADNIHGVTMERPGISRIISMKIPAAA